MSSMTEGLPPMRPVPPSPEPRRNWGLIAAWSVVVVSGLLGLTVFVIFIVVYGGHDRIELIEDEAIVAAIKGPCAHLRVVEERRPVTGTNAQRAEALLAQVEAGKPIVTALDALDQDWVDADHPTRAWTEDWRELLGAVGAYANRLKSGEAGAFEMPLTEDEYSIVGRMDWAAGPECTVPKSFSALDPSAKLPAELRSAPRG